MTVKNTQELQRAIKHIEKARSILIKVHAEERKRYYRLAYWTKIQAEYDAMLIQLESLFIAEQDLKSTIEDVNKLIETK